MLYYLPYKAILTFVNIASCYYSIYKYAKYFAKRHPKIIEDERAVAVVLRLEEESVSGAKKAPSIHGRASVDDTSRRARRFTVTAVGTNLSSALPQEYQQGDDTTNTDVVDFAAQSALPPNDYMSDGPRRKSNRIPPPIPPARHPFSWHRSTSKASSNSGISPFDEHERPHLPLLSPEMTALGPSLQQVNGQTPIPNRVESPRLAQSAFSTTLLLRRSSSDRSVPFRLNFGARRPSPSTSNPSQRRVLRHHSSTSTNLTFDLSTPTIEPPAPILVREPYRFATLSKVEEDVRRGPPRRPEPDINRYIHALADTGGPRPESRDRLFIREEDEWEEEASRKEDSIRKSTQTDRTSWGSRQRWAP